jgi:hypothetical protein
VQLLVFIVYSTPLGQTQRRGMVCFVTSDVPQSDRSNDLEIC